MARATLDDIADKLGVSPMTVSRALRGVGRVSPDTRRRVREAALALGYGGLQQGVLGAPAHRGRSDQDLRLFVPIYEQSADHASGDLGGELLAGVRERLSVNGGSVEVLQCRSLEEILVTWRERHFTAAILRSPTPRAWVERLRELGPVVMAVSHDFHPGVDAAYINEMRAASMVADYLIRQGHAQIAWVGLYDLHYPLGLPPEYFDPGAWSDRPAASIHAPRYAAWSYVSRYFRPEAPQPLLLGTRDWRCDSLADTCRRLLDQVKTCTPRPTAIVTPSDIMAVTLRQLLAADGLRVPEDFSLVAYGGTSALHGVQPAITAVKLPMFTIGKAIPELVERRLADPDAVAITLQVEASLREGRSVLLRQP